MVTLILLEGLVNWLGRGKRSQPPSSIICYIKKKIQNVHTFLLARHNIADSVTSISCGLVMTMVGLFSKAACLNLYAWVHTHYRSGALLALMVAMMEF